jgi:hypothetical protein
MTTTTTTTTLTRSGTSAAAAGVVFVVLDVAATFLPGAPPASDASAARIAQYFTDHSGAIKAQLLIGGLGVAALVWWFGTLWRMMSRAEDERPRLAMVAAVGLTAGLVLAIISTVITTTAAMRVDNIETTHLLYRLSLVTISAAGFGVGTSLLAAGIVIYRGNLAPRWTSYLARLAALAFLASTGGAVSDANAFNILGVLAFLIWCVWILALSAVMWRADSPATTS